MRRWLLAAALLCWPLSILAEWKNEPTSYRSVPFGSTQADAMAALDNLNVCTKETGGGMLACTDARSSFMLGTVAINERLFFPDGTFVQVVIEFSSNSHDFVRSVFVEKFGEPHRLASERFKTRGGAEFQNEVATWEGKEVIVVLRTFGGDVGTSRAIIATKQFLESEDERAKVARKAAASAF